MGLKLAVGLLFVALAVASSASATRHIVFEANGGPAQVRPKTIYASPTNGPFAKRLVWSGWGQDRATAEGTVYYDTCEPNCSEGYHSTSGEVILSGVHRSGRQLRYSLLRIIYFPTPQYNLRATYNCNGTPIHIHIGR